MTVAAVRECIKNPYIAKKPVTITAYFNDNLDCSNHAAEFKMIEDGLKGLLIEDDSRKYVKGILIYFHDKEYILVQVKEIDIE